MKTRRLSGKGKSQKCVAGRPGYEIFKSRGLVAERCRPPNGLSRIYRASGLAFWRYGNPRFDARLSEIRWDGDTSYPHSTGCCGTSSRFFPPTSSTDGIRRTSFKGSTGSSEPPKCNACWPARKPSRPTRCAQASFRFHSSRRNSALPVGVQQVVSHQQKISENVCDSRTAASTLPPQRGMKTGAYLLSLPGRRERTGSPASRCAS